MQDTQLAEISLAHRDALHATVFTGRAVIVWVDAAAAKAGNQVHYITAHSSLTALLNSALNMLRVRRDQTSCHVLYKESRVE